MVQYLKSTKKIAERDKNTEIAAGLAELKITLKDELRVFITKSQERKTTTKNYVKKLIQDNFLKKKLQ